MDRSEASDPKSTIRAVGEFVGIRGLVVILLYLALFLPQLVYLASVVWPEVKYSHGYLIPLVSLWYISQYREELQSVERRPSLLGLLPLTIGILFWLMAQVQSFNALAHLSMMLVLVGVVLYTSGWRFTRAMGFPLLYLVFVFPVPKRLDDLYVVLPLQRLAATVSAKIIEFTGIPVLREGNVIEVPGVQLFVEEACSGLHSLYSLIALGTAFVFLTERRNWEKVLLIVSTVPIAIAANVVRVTLTGILAARVSPDFARGDLHEYSGLLVFLLGLSMLILLAAALRWWFPVPADSEETPGDGESTQPGSA